MGRGVGEGCRHAGLHWRGGSCGHEACVTAPDEAGPRLVAHLWVGIEEFICAIVQSVVISLKLPLEDPISQAAPLAQQDDHLVHNRDKVHIPADSYEIIASE